MDIDASEIRYLGDLQRLEPRPGDVYVLTCERVMSADQAAQLRAQFKSVMGEQARVIVLSGGLQLGAVALPQEG